jgi:hypothetical protein
LYILKKALGFGDLWLAGFEDGFTGHGDALDVQSI